MKLAIDMLWSRPTPSRHKQLATEDIVLSVLYASEGRPIRGKLVFMKTVFVAIKQVFQDYEREFGFIPYDYGPYSPRFAKTLNDLLERGLVTSRIVQISEDKVRYDYSLTPSGRIQAEESYGMLSPEQANLLKTLVGRLEGLGYTDFLRYVYSRYPEYAIASKIRAEVHG